MSGRGDWLRDFSFTVDLRDHCRFSLKLNQITIRELLFQPLPCSVRRQFHDACQPGLSPARFSLRHGVGGAFVRIVGGFLIASIVVHLIDAEGVNRQVLLLSSALRPAVIHFVLTEKYGKDPDLAASIVVLNTLLSILSIPLLFWMIL